MNEVSANTYLRTLKAAFNTAVRLNLLRENPFKNCRLLRIPAKEPAYIRKEEFATFLSVVRDDWLRHLVMVAALTGMRRGELISLRWRDVDLRNRLIHIRNKDDFTVKGMRPRSIPINRDLLAIILRMPRGSEFLLVDARGNPLNGSVVTKKFKQAVTASGLPDGIHFHSLRHSYASWLVQSSTPLAEVQRLLGHTSVVTTQIYSHLEEEHLRNAADRIRLEDFTPKGLLQ